MRFYFVVANLLFAFVNSYFSQQRIPTTNQSQQRTHLQRQRGKAIDNPSQKIAIVTTLLPWTASIAPKLAPPTSFKTKRLLSLRNQVAYARDEVSQATREINALQSRLRLLDHGETKLSLELRVKRLRLEAGLHEARIIVLKKKQRKMGLASRNNFLGNLNRKFETFMAAESKSSDVLLRLLSRDNPWEMIRQDSLSLLSMGTKPSLVSGYFFLNSSEQLIPHAAAIAARAEILEEHAPGILVAVDGYLDIVEPHLDKILERLDVSDSEANQILHKLTTMSLLASLASRFARFSLRSQVIEPHLPFVLKNMNFLAPHIGCLLPHLDALLLFADDGGKYLDRLLPYVSKFAPLLDALKPHLLFLRPHLKHIMPHFHIIQKSAINFKDYPSVSANADVLVFYFGWVLR